MVKKKKFEVLLSNGQTFTYITSGALSARTMARKDLKEFKIKARITRICWVL